MIAYIILHYLTEAPQDRADGKLKGVMNLSPVKENLGHRDRKIMNSLLAVVFRSYGGFLSAPTSLPAGSSSLWCVYSKHATHTKEPWRTGR